MSQGDDPRPKKDAKTQLEEQLVQRAAEPWAKKLGKDEQEGLRIFLNLFVKTHPAMQSMVARRVQEDAPTSPVAADAKADNAVAPTTDGVAETSNNVPENTSAQLLVDASGIVAKPDSTQAGPKGKAGAGR